jgi:teichuronic acid exporter
LLRDRARSATFWSGADIFGRQLLQFSVSIVLARLLSPEEFGTVALLSLFSGVATSFVDSGFSVALIQRQDVTRVDESTVFWFNLAMGTAMALALWAAAPAVAAVFSQPVLVSLTRVMAATIFVNSLGSIHATLLTKRLDFRTQMKVGTLATLCSGVIAVGLASRGYGVWALAAQILSSATATTGLLWLFDPWRPQWSFSRQSARRLFGFGGYMFASGLLDTVYNRLYSLLIGKFYSTRDLGFYNRADNTKQLPVGVLTGILGRVALPILSAAAHDKAQLRRGVRLALRGMMLVNVPMMLGLASLAEPLVVTLFGPRWLPAVPVLRVLCIGGVLWPLHVINLNVLVAQGHSNLFFRLETAKKIVGVALLAVGSSFGILGIAWSQAVFGVLAFVINAHYTKRYLDYGSTAQARDILPVLTIAVATLAIVRWFAAIAQPGPTVELLGSAAIGTVLFVAVAWLCRLTAMRDTIALLRRPSLTLPISASAI